MLVFFVISFFGLAISNSNSVEYSVLETHITKLTALNRDNSESITTRNDEVRDYIITELSSVGGIEKAPDSSDNDINNGYNNINFVDNKPTYLVQKATINSTTSNAIAKETGFNYSGTTVNNVVVAFPGVGNDNNKSTVVFHVAYDAPLYVNGAMMAATDVAVMLETVKQYSKDVGSHANDVVFVFGQNSVANLGLHAFVKQFSAFGGIGGRTKLAIGLRGIGASGPLTLVDSVDNNAKVMSKIGFSGTASNSYSDFVSTQYPNYDKIAGLNIPYATFANIGNLSFANSHLDNNISKDTVQAKAGFLQRTVNKLQGEDIADLSSSSQSVVFSYFGLNISLSSIFYIVLGILMLLGVVGLLVYGSYKSILSIQSIVKAGLVQILALVGVVLISLVLYYIVAWLFLVARGLIPLDLINRFVFYNPGLLIGFLLLGLASSNALYSPLKRVFKVRAVDIVRATVLILAIVAAIVSFVAPTISAPLVWLALLQLVVLYINTAYKQKFKDKYNRDIERMFFYAIPVILTLPIIIPSIIMVAQVIAMPWYSLIAAFSAMVFGFGLPYLSFLKPVFDRGLEKLPKARIVEVSIVEREVEHKAKKGRYRVEKVKQKKVVKKPLKYHTAVGTIFVAIVASIVMFVSASPATTFGARVDSGSYHAIYNNSLVLAWEGGNLNWEVKDSSTFRYFDNIKDSSGTKLTNGFYFNSSSETFQKVESKTEYFDGEASITAIGDGKYDIKPASPNTSQIDLVAKGTANVRELVFKVGDDEMLRVVNPNREDTVRISLPYGFGSLASGSSFRVEATTTTAGSGQSITWEYYEYNYNQNDLGRFELWASLRDYFEEVGMLDDLRGGIVYRIIQ